jgi:hypothetical protein
VPCHFSPERKLERTWVDMNFDKRLLIESIGLAAVVLSLIFLGIEVQQNSLLMRSQIRDSVTNKQLDFYTISGASAEASDVIARALRGTVEGNLSEQQQFTHWANAALRMWENEWFQYQNGLFDDEEFLPRMEVWRRMTQFPGFQMMWNGIISVIPILPGFVSRWIGF